MINTYIELANTYLGKKKPIVFPEELFENLNPEEAGKIIDTLDQNAMMRLPEKEIEFFEWVKSTDPLVWKDLWEDEEFAEYIVSVSFLPLLVYKSQFNGFPICDLISVDNYYFTIDMMIAEHSQTVLEAAKDKFQNQIKLDLHQLLALEIAFNSIDIWHFAWKYHISLESAKQALDILIQDKALYHFRKAEDISKYLHF